MTKQQKITLSASRDILFDKLWLSQSNVRHGKAGVSIQELAEDIPRWTLLASLTVWRVLLEANADAAITLEQLKPLTVNVDPTRLEQVQEVFASIGNLQERPLRLFGGIRKVKRRITAVGRSRPRGRKGRELPVMLRHRIRKSR